MEVDNKNSYMFTFTWSISDFRHCAVKPNRPLKSPEFEVEFLKDSKFYLELYPKGEVTGFSSIYLCQEKETPSFFFDIFIFKRYEDFKTPSEEEMGIFSAPACGYEQFYRIRNLASYLSPVYGALTVYCCILRKDTVRPMTVQCSANTEIKVTKLLYTWMLKDVLNSKQKFDSNMNRIVRIPNFSSSIPSFEIRFFLKLDSDDRFIHFAIESFIGSRTFYLVHDVALLDSNGSVAHTVQGRNLFAKSTTKQIVEFSFLSMRKLLLNKQLYLPNGGLTLQCKFSISTNDVENYIETIEYGSTKDLLFKSEDESESFKREADHWDENTLKLYEEGKFSDFIIRSASRDFPVHKAILAAQSEVFSAAFEQDMKDQNTGVLEIKDLDDGTISHLLTFIYRNKLSGVDFPFYLKLFKAADRYKITKLRKLCLNQLQYMFFEDALTVCAVLALADAHQEHELKTSAQAHILEKACDIIDSEPWKKLMETHPRLTSETMHKIICKKVLKDNKNLGYH